MHLSISVVPSRPGEWDAGFDSIFREQRKRRATDSEREKTDRTDRDRHFCQGRMLSQNTSSIPTNSSACPRSRQQGKLGQLVTLRCQQILVPPLDFPRSMQGWDFLNFQAEFWGSLFSFLTPSQYCHLYKGYSSPPRRSAFCQRAEEATALILWMNMRRCGKVEEG